MNNIYEDIARMRKGMKMIGCTKKEIEAATKDVTEADSHEEALTRIKKYWR